MKQTYLLEWYIIEYYSSTLSLLDDFSKIIIKIEHNTEMNSHSYLWDGVRVRRHTMRGDGRWMRYNNCEYKINSARSPLTYCALINSIASSKSSTGTIAKTGPNISSFIRASSKETSRTIVGAMRRFEGSFSPPSTIFPLVLSSSFVSRWKCASEMIRVRDSDWSAPSG